MDFQNYPSWLNLLLFAGMACVIWYAGTKLQRLADIIARRTGLGHAFVGVLLLAGATSLTEITTTITAVWIGNISMAVHNQLGAVVFNTAALVVADIASGRAALTHRSPRYVLVLTGTGVVFLLALVLMASSMIRGVEQTSSMAGWVTQFRLWEVLICIAYLGLLFMVHRAQKNPRWRPMSPSDKGRKSDDELPEEDPVLSAWSSPKIYVVFAATSFAVLVAAWFLTRTGDSLAVQTGLGSGFVGFAMLSLASTLPEMSTTVTATRAGNNDMAVSNIFGSSAFNIVLLGLTGIVVGADVLYQAASPTGSFAVGLGMAATLVYLWGLLEHEDRTILRMGWDSAAVILLVVGGSGVIYLLGQTALQGNG